MSQIHLYLMLVCSLLMLVIGVKVYNADKNNVVNRSFSIFSFTASTWLLFDYLAYQVSLSAYQLYINRAVFTILCVMIFSLAWFSLVFPKYLFRVPKPIAILLGAFCVFLVLISAFSKGIVENISMQGWGSDVVFGKYFYLFIIYIIFFTLAPTVLLVLKYILFSASDRLKIKFMFYGIICLVVFNLLFNMLLPLLTGSFEYARFGSFSAIIFVAFSAYAIMKQSLFDVRVIVTETAIIIINVFSVVQIFDTSSTSELASRIFFLLVMLYGSNLLLKSMKQEIRQKEELANLADSLEDANSKLEELDEQKDNFISMASHELNTPVAAIEGYLSMIIDEKMGGEINPKMRKYLSNVYLSSKRLAALIKDLLNVSRIESNRIHIIYEEAQIEDVIEQSITEIKFKADEAKHTLTFKEPAGKLPKTWFDVPRITEVIINILGNSIKYTDPGGKIAVEAHADADKIVVSVTDNGRGIPKEDYGKIYEKFMQVNVLTDQIKGTGLGMFISKNLVELHKGKLWFKSNTDKDDHGTTFYFSLPILKSKPADPHEGEGALFQPTAPKAISETSSTETKSDENKTDNTAAPLSKEECVKK